MDTKDLSKFSNRSGEVIDCRVCGDQFYAARHRLKPGAVVTCSRECASTYKKSQAPLNVNCAQCGKKFHMKPSHAVKTKRPSCSKECCRQLQRQRMTGAGNHQYGLTGESNSSWGGGRRLTTYGYIKDGDILEHRKVWLDSGREIPDGFIVHHKNHIKTDNRLVNLEIMSLSDHSKGHNISRSCKRNLENGRFLKSRGINEHKQYIVSNYKELLPDVLSVIGLNVDDVGLDLTGPQINKLYNVSEVDIDHLIEHVKHVTFTGDWVALKGAMHNLTYKLYIEGVI